MQQTLTDSRPPSSAVSRPVDATLSEIITLHGEIITAARTALSKAIRIGQLLTEQKAKLKHGEWLPWVKENLPFDDSQARRYMTVFNRRDEISNRVSTHDLTFTEAYRLLAAPGETTRADSKAAKVRADFRLWVDTITMLAPESRPFVLNTILAHAREAQR